MDAVFYSVALNAISMKKKQSYPKRVVPQQSREFRTNDSKVGVRSLAFSVNRLRCERGQLRKYLLSTSVEDTRVMEARTYTAMGEGTPSAGGYLVPETLESLIFDKLKAVDRLFDRNVVTMVETESGQKTSVVVDSDISASAQIVNENSASTDGPDPSLAVAVFTLLRPGARAESARLSNSCKTLSSRLTSQTQ